MRTGGRTYSFALLTAVTVGLLLIAAASRVAGAADQGSDPIDPLRFTTDTRAGYDWWALQPVVRPEPPKVNDAAWIDNAVDAFILAELENRDLSPSPPADRRTLIRRLSFDLLGLPPTPEAVADFLSDTSSDAYTKRVDRMLASPRYGERWARHWLDVARFGESQGFERDKLRPHAWRFRDWVIDAFNRNLPYDEFARLQLAGDVLRPNDPSAVTATGFLVAGPYDEVGQNQQSAAMKAVVRQDELEDIVGTVGQTFLGLTVNCARCHDHKFDPVRQVEYYRLAAALAGVRHGERELDPESVRTDTQIRDAAFAARIRFLSRRLAATDKPAVRERVRFEIAHIEAQRKRSRSARVYAVTPRRPEVVHLLLRGNPAQKGNVVSAGGVASLAGVEADFQLMPDAPEAQRRIRLARWITAAANPLFARVIVNRLWHHHFGTGLVNTPSDFGFNGGRPTHPELLDWLADELVRENWSLKSLHRTIVTSAAYRQASRFNASAARADAGSRYLWRKNPRRLEAEVIRDTVLAVAGELNSAIGGPGYHDFRSVTNNSQFYEPIDPVGHSFNRRSVYRLWVRSGRNRFLDVFDCPDPSTTAPSRAVTTTPLQSLAMLNHPFVLRMADRLATRLERVVGDDVERQIRRAYALVYGRDPRRDELAPVASFVREHGLSALCRVLFNSNEFLYVD